MIDLEASVQSTFPEILWSYPLLLVQESLSIQKTKKSKLFSDMTFQYQYIVCVLVAVTDFLIQVLWFAVIAPEAALFAPD